MGRQVTRRKHLSWFDKILLVRGRVSSEGSIGVLK